MEEYDVFISYSRKDTPIAREITQAFDRAGIKYFIDIQGICGGMEFPEVLSEAILNSKLMLFLASENSYSSKFTKNEVMFAFNKKPDRFIVPYIIDGSKMPVSLEFMLGNINWLNLQEHPINTHLVDNILEMLGRDAESEVSVLDAILGEYDPRSVDISVSYETGGFLYICLAGSGRKFKIDVRNYHGLSEDEIYRKISLINSEDKDCSGGSPTPGYDFFISNYEMLEKNQTLTIMVQNNPESFAYAYKLQKLIQERKGKCYIRMAPSVYAMGIAGFNSEAVWNGAVRFGSYEVVLESGFGIININKYDVANDYEPIVLSNLVKGLVILHCIVSGLLKNTLLVDIVGIPLSISSVNDNVPIEAETSIPARWTEDDWKGGKEIVLRSGEYVIDDKIRIYSDKRLITFEITADRTISIY